MHRTADAPAQQVDPRAALAFVRSGRRARRRRQPDIRIQHGASEGDRAPHRRGGGTGHGGGRTVFGRDCLVWGRGQQMPLALGRAEWVALVQTAPHNIVAVRGLVLHGRPVRSGYGNGAVDACVVQEPRGESGLLYPAARDCLGLPDRPNSLPLSFCVPRRWALAAQCHDSRRGERHVRPAPVHGLTEFGPLACRVENKQPKAPFGPDWGFYARGCSAVQRISLRRGKAPHLPLYQPALEPLGGEQQGHCLLWTADAHV